MLLSSLLIIPLLGVILIFTNVFNKTKQSKFSSLKCKISNLYNSLATLHLIYRFIILIILVILLIFYKFLWKSLLTILPDVSTTVEQFYLFVVIFIFTILTYLIFLLIKSIDTITINYKTITISALLSISIVLLIKFLFIDLINIILPLLSSVLTFFVYESIEGNYKFSANNILAADRYSGMETGESSKSASIRDESYRGAATSNSDTSNSDKVNKDTDTEYSKKHNDIFLKNASLTTNRRYSEDTLTMFLNEENILAKNLREAKDELNSNPGNALALVKVGLANKELDHHQNKFDNVYERALVRRKKNLDGINELNEILPLIERKIIEAEVEKKGKFEVFVFKQKRDSCYHYISLFEKDNQSINKSLKIIPGGHLDVPRSSVSTESYAPRVIRTHNNTIGLLPNLDNRPSIDLIVSKDHATKRIADNEIITESLVPEFEDLNKKTEIPTNSNLMDRYKKVCNTIDRLNEENDKLSNKFNIERSPTPEDR